eukprot:823811-Prymnesium_polylepis.1
MIALEGLDDASRMKGVMLAVQHDAGAGLVDRVHADGTRHVLAPEHAILVCGIVDALHKRIDALLFCELHGQTEGLLVFVRVRNGIDSRRNSGDVVVAAFGHYFQTYQAEKNGG